jgi:superfamily I DNA and RNA helicase
MDRENKQSFRKYADMLVDAERRIARLHAMIDQVTDRSVLKIEAAFNEIENDINKLRTDGTRVAEEMSHAASNLQSNDWMDVSYTYNSKSFDKGREYQVQRRSAKKFSITDSILTGVTEEVFDPGGSREWKSVTEHRMELSKIKEIRVIDWGDHWRVVIAGEPGFYRALLKHIRKDGSVSNNPEFVYLDETWFSYRDGELAQQAGRALSAFVR